MKQNKEDKQYIADKAQSQLQTRKKSILWKIIFAAELCIIVLSLLFFFFADSCAASYIFVPGILHMYSIVFKICMVEICCKSFLFIYLANTILLLFADFISIIVGLAGIINSRKVYGACGGLFPHLSIPFVIMFSASLLLSFVNIVNIGFIYSVYDRQQFSSSTVSIPRNSSRAINVASILDLIFSAFLWIIEFIFYTNQTSRSFILMQVPHAFLWIFCLACSCGASVRLLNITYWVLVYCLCSGIIIVLWALISVSTTEDYESGILHKFEAKSFSFSVFVLQFIILIVDAILYYFLSNSLSSHVDKWTTGRQK